jgi:hypothetical protein
VREGLVGLHLGGPIFAQLACVIPKSYFHSSTAFITPPHQGYKHTVLAIKSYLLTILPLYIQELTIPSSTRLLPATLPYP